MPYSNVRHDEMTLRDHLARDRTMLANERTLLAYIRTAIALLAAGGTLLTVFPGNLPLRGLGFLLLVCGAIMAIVGSRRYSIVAGHMRRLGVSSSDMPEED
jgi:putative membrane protein